MVGQPTPSGYSDLGTTPTPARTFPRSLSCLGSAQGVGAFVVPTQTQEPGLPLPWFPLASVPDHPSYGEEAPSRVTIWHGAGGHHVCPKMTRALERHPPGP